MPWELYKQELQTYANKFDKSIKLFNKDNWFCYLIAWILYIISFGKYNRSSFLTSFATTIGNLHFYPKEWGYNSVKFILPHESAHTKQFRLFSLGIHPLLGVPLGLIIYVFFLFPVFLAIGRFFMELHADYINLKQLKQDDYTYLELQEICKHRSKVLSGIEYMFAVPKKVSDYLYNKVLESIYDE